MATKRTWQEELAIVDNTMKAISGEMDPQKLVDLYWKGIGDLQPILDYVALSRRNVDPPYYLVTRSTRFTQDLNPWTQRNQLPKLKGGVLGELAYANKPVIIEDLKARLKPDDPGWFYLQGFSKLVALPQYDAQTASNIAVMLLDEGSTLDESKIPAMHWHSSLFGRGTQNLVLRNQLADAMASLDQELQAVGEIQRGLLPSTLPKIDGYEFGASYHTSARAGGDYYDFFPLADGKLGIFIADVSGHGTPAAVLMAITHVLAHSQPGSHTPPYALLSHLNKQLMRAYLSGGMFVTAFYAVLDPVACTLTYSRAGHNPPRLLRGGSVIALDETGSLPLGVLIDETFGETTIQLQPGDKLVLYTDGITEAMSPEVSGSRRNLFGENRLDEVLRLTQCSCAQDCIASIRDAVTKFTGNAPVMDDQTLIVICCTQPGKPCH